MSMKRLIAGGVWLGLLALPVSGRPAEEPPAQEAPAPATYARALKFLDLDGNGWIEPRELGIGQQMGAMILALEWAECDADGDGSLSAAEFEQVAAKTLQALLTKHSDAEAESEKRAQEDLAGATSLSVILERLARSPRYVDEIAALRKVIEDLDDEDEVVAYVVGHPALYPRLGPLVHTWLRTYPVRPDLLRHAKPRADVRPPPAAAPPQPAAPRPKTEKPPHRKGPPGPAKPARKSPHAPPPPAARP